NVCAYLMPEEFAMIFDGKLANIYEKFRTIYESLIFDISWISHYHFIRSSAIMFDILSFPVSCLKRDGRWQNILIMYFFDGMQTILCVCRIS
ncbi:MAG: hypothetical protein VB071_12195, partial [Lawsonibacter sp.]|nr:hypothetical protein [Lawsonibacter sp.]